mmetsp:Transcript_7378/g.26252  ORF Transcript_7378/g.26252 Transcript_7378/m.26252 type:complete len:140 (+) Transcript_7378:657-1076(+)
MSLHSFMSLDWATTTLRCLRDRTSQPFRPPRTSFHPRQDTDMFPSLASLRRTASSWSVFLSFGGPVCGPRGVVFGSGLDGDPISPPKTRTKTSHTDHASERAKKQDRKIDGSTRKEMMKHVALPPFQKQPAMTTQEWTW